MGKRRTPVVQVEQLLDDGTHPTIVQALFAVEADSPAPYLAAPVVTVPACPGQLAISGTGVGVMASADADGRHGVRP